MRFYGLLFLAYLVGSINFAILILGLMGKPDPRAKFSGNAGTTNVYRLAGRGWASVVLLLDVGRGLTLAMAAITLLPFAHVPWVGLALVAGNRFPCFHKFRGGKGVASYLGFTIPIAPWGALFSCLVWIAVQRIARVPFIASLFMILILGGATAIVSGGQLRPLAGVAVTLLLIFYNHKVNIILLLGQKRQR